MSEQNGTATRHRKAKRTSDERIIMRQAKLLDKQRATLGDISLEAVRIATMQLAVQKLEMALRLLESAGLARMAPPTAVQQPTPPPPPPVQNPCVMCGRPGVYQAKARDVRTGQLLPSDKRPWYCRGEHANFAMAEDGEDEASKRRMGNLNPVSTAPTPQAQPSAAPPPSEAASPPPGLASAMAALRGGNP